MESIQEQFESFNSFFQDMRKGLKEIKAAQRSNTTRARPSTTPTRFQTPEDEEVDNPDHYFGDFNNKLGRVVPRHNGVQYGLKRRRSAHENAWILRRSGRILANKKVPQLLTKIQGRIFSRKGRMIRIPSHSTMELKGAWVPQLLTKIRGRIFSRKGGKIRIRYHSTIELKETWRTTKEICCCFLVDQLQEVIQRDMGQPCPYMFKTKLHKSFMILITTSVVWNLKAHLGFVHCWRHMLMV
ncbi:hypothetical protein JCGZ_15237 [Jatropha curcas]|uniref:Uncharacterized protein n=1 Tax=Jatropha curcas TaxID=180498 RepID=A0A067K651_JATCU|nr:hypothetical protein JCGZ_15237 [Jatropha curcas]